MLREVSELPSLRRKSRRLLAVFPHPDDEAYGPAGTIARAGAEPDTATVVFCLTRGEASSMGPARGLRPEQVGALRERRMVEVARILGLDGMVIGGLPDGGLARMDFRELAEAVRVVLEAFEPQVVIGHDARGVNGHPDHIATHWALRPGLLRHPARFAMMAYPAAVAELAKPRLLFPTPDDEIDAEITLSEAEADAKEACLRVHEALVTLREDARPGLARRPPIERYAFFGEDFTPPVADVFAGLPSRR